MTSSFEGSITAGKRAQRAAVGTGSCEVIPSFESETGMITSEPRTRKHKTSKADLVHEALRRQKLPRVCSYIDL